MAVEDVQGPPEVTASGYGICAKLLLRQLGVQAFELCDLYRLANLWKVSVSKNALHQAKHEPYINMCRLSLVNRVEIQSSHGQDFNG